MDGMDFYAVDTGIFELLCAQSEGVDELLYLLLGHLSGRDFVRPAVGAWRCGGRDLV